jgi:hypothetical protein
MLDLLVRFKTAPVAEWATPPAPASRLLPNWLKEMPQEVPQEPGQQGWPLGTPRKCAPFVDAMLTGYMMLLPMAVRVVVTEDHQVLFSARPEVPWRPIGRHVPVQTMGSPLDPVFRFEIPWALELPEGWSVLYTHPLNRVELPFYTLAGVVDEDYESPVNLPFVWTDWEPREFTMDAGTPVAQLIPFQRARWEHLVLANVEESEMYVASAGAASKVDGYRRFFRKAKVYR